MNLLFILQLIFLNESVNLSNTILYIFILFSNIILLNL